MARAINLATLHKALKPTLNVNKLYSWPGASNFQSMIVSNKSNFGSNSNFQAHTNKPILSKALLNILLQLKWLIGEIRIYACFVINHLPLDTL